MLRALLAERFGGRDTMTALATQGLFNSVAQTVGFIVGPSLAIEHKASGLVALWITAALCSISAWKLPCCQDKRIPGRGH